MVQILKLHLLHHVAIDDLQKKTFYKVFLKTDLKVVFHLLSFQTLTVNTIQPPPLSILNAKELLVFWNRQFGSTKFGTKLLKLFEAQVVGSGFTVSFQFDSDDTNPPYSIDALTVEYGLNDRR